MAAEMAIGHTKKQTAMAKVLPADEWKNYNNMTSDLEGFKQLAFHAACAAIPMYGVYRARQTGSIYSLIIFELLVGYVASFYFTAYHEIIHMTAFRSKWISKGLSYPIGFAIFRGPNWFWCFHWFHHRYTQDPERDPEISGESSDLIDPSKSIWAYCKFMTGWSFGFERIGKMAQGLMQEDPWVIQSGLQTTVRIESIVFVSLYLSLAVGSIINAQVRETVLLYWLVPHMIGAGQLRFYQFCEHRGCETGHYSDLDAWGCTRTTETWWIYARLAWNMPYHIEHHSWPAVPFYLLPALHKRIKESQPTPRALIGGESGYIAVHIEFLRRIWRGETTTAPPVEHVQDPENDAKPFALEQRRAEMINMANGRRASIDMAEVAKHNSHTDCWLVVNGIVIDATTFIPEHPGGQMVLAEKAGRDASLMFRMVHPEGTLESKLPDRCIVGLLAKSNDSTANGNTSEPLKQPLLA